MGTQLLWTLQLIPSEQAGTRLQASLGTYKSSLFMFLQIKYLVMPVFAPQMPLGSRDCIDASNRMSPMANPSFHLKATSAKGQSH